MIRFQEPWRLCLLAGVLATGAHGQVPPELAEQLRAIGPVVNPAATAPLYAPRIREKEPVADVRVDRDLAYGPAPRHRLDVFAVSARPSQPRPVLVFVHGGAFVAGNKKLNPSSPFYDNVAMWAARQGMVGVNITYRLAPQDPWPAGPQDIGRAIGWIHENIAALGGDPARVYLLGHSAGASHVAAYVAHPEFYPLPDSGLAGALLLSGVYRITPELVEQSPGYASYFGKDPDRYATQSSLEGLVASPVPLWVGSAELDPPSFRAQAQLLRERLQAAGRRFASADFAGHSHMSTAYSIHSDDASVGNALSAFIDRDVEGHSILNPTSRWIRHLGKVCPASSEPHAHSTLNFCGFRSPNSESPRIS
jgi:triacylglycerol lipase